MNNFIILALLSFTLATHANQDVYWSKAKLLDRKATRTNIEFTYSSSLGQFDNQGTKYDIPEGFAYSYMDLDIDFQYGITKKFQLLTGLKGRYASSTDSSNDNTAAGLESFDLGMIYAFGKQKNRNYAMSVIYRFRPYTPEIYQSSASVPTDEIVLGDGGNDLEFNFHGFLNQSRWTSYDFLIGYRIPGADLSSEIPYEFRIVKHYVDWAFWLSLNGVYSLGGDTYTDNPAAKPPIASGPTANWNSVNRQWLNTDFSVQTKLGRKYLLAFNAGYKVLGESSDQDFHAGLGLSWRTGGKSAQQKFEETFKEYTLEADVVKVSARGSFVKIDRGSLDDIQKGDVVDIYKTDYFGGNLLVAQGRVYEVTSNDCIVKIVEKYRQVPIEKGYVARVK